jgi:hypothetical protein
MQALAGQMAPVRYHLLSDLLHPDFPADQVRLAVFANAFELSPRIRQAIRDKLQRDDKVLLYVHAAGAIRGGSPASTAQISELLGFTVARGPGARATRRRLPIRAGPGCEEKAMASANRSRPGFTCRQDNLA